MEPNPSNLQTWNPYAIYVIGSAVLLTIGTGIGWLITNGPKAYAQMIKARQQRRLADLELKQKEEELKQRQQQSKNLIDRLLEEKHVTGGLRTALLMYDERVRELENDNVDLRNQLQDIREAHRECTELHDRERKRGDKLESDAQEMRRRYNSLAELVERMRSKMLRMNPHDPELFPSPPPKNIEQE